MLKITCLHENNPHRLTSEGIVFIGYYKRFRSNVLFLSSSVYLIMNIRQVFPEM